MRTTQKERRVWDVSLGVLSGIFGTLAVDSLVSVLTADSFGGMRFLLFIILGAASLISFLRAIRKF